jgi:hypothetical protein
MTAKHAIPLLLALSVSPAVFAQSTTPYFEMDAFLLSEPIAIDALSNDWDAEYHPDGEHQIASIWVEAGIKRGSWSFGALYREEHQLLFSPDTAELYYTVENDKDLDAGRRYNIDLNAYRFRGVGARVSKQFKPSNSLQVSVGTSLFQASNLLEGNLSGSALADTSNQYEYQFDVDYSYDEDVLFGRRDVEGPTGIGLAVDLAAVWKPRENIQFSAKIKDLAGAIRWKDAPFTKATANSDSVVLNDNGFSQVNPILSGSIGSKSSYTQTLKPSADLAAAYQFAQSPYTASLKSKHYEELNLIALGGSRKLGSGELALHYWPQIETLEANFQGKRFGMSIGLDNMDLSEAQAVWLSMKYR